jgi:hypothetical protein
MAEVTYDSRSFFLDGERIWIVSGSVHYFRIPRPLWADRLAKARQGGLNCVATPVPWNLHEPEEGDWRFDGGRDVVEFVRLAQDAGLYVILRPGPYIGADWDFGGLPPWLEGVSGIAYRTANAAFTHYVDKYFQNLLVRLADLQVTRGGNILLIQCEHDYPVGESPDRANYLRFCTQLIRRSGFDIPVITSNRLADPSGGRTIEGVRGRNDLVGQVNRLRRARRDQPLLVTELRTAPPPRWGEPIDPAAADDLPRRALEVLGSGGQYNIYPWQGGTNFSFWAGASGEGPDGFCATSYDCLSPVAEGGGETSRFLSMRPVNLLARHMAPFLAQASLQDPGARATKGQDVLNLAGPLARWVVVTSGGDPDIQAVDVVLPSGAKLTVPVGPLGASAVPAELLLTEQHRVDHTDLMPLGLFGEALLVLHGPAGWPATVRLDGQTLRPVVPEGDKVDLIDHNGLRLAVINTDLAMRTWPMEDRLVFGPLATDEEGRALAMPPKTTRVTVLPLAGKPSVRSAKVQAPSRAAPRLRKWKLVEVCSEPTGGQEGWSRLDRPRSLSRLGTNHGYGWYRVTFSEARARKRNLLLPQCRDRATVFLNGKRVGVWGAGPDAKRTPINVSVKKGDNTLCLLVDNLGRSARTDRLDGSKGLTAHVHDAKALKPKSPRLLPDPTFARRWIPRAFTHLLDELRQGPIHAVDLPFALTQPTAVHVQLEGLPYHLAAFCNDRLVRFFPRWGESSWGEMTLKNGLRKGDNVLRLIVWGPFDKAHLQGIAMHQLLEPVTREGRWQYKPWSLPASSGQAETDAPAKGVPCWWSTRFNADREVGPIMLHLDGLEKGQVLLNGQNVGRHWQVGPQPGYYLPECWIGEDNELLVFEESGSAPGSCKLTVQPTGPFGED